MANREKVIHPSLRPANFNTAHSIEDTENAIIDTAARVMAFPLVTTIAYLSAAGDEMFKEVNRSLRDVSAFWANVFNPPGPGI